jgi:hypothetical protein
MSEIAASPFAGCWNEFRNDFKIIADFCSLPVPVVEGQSGIYSLFPRTGGIQDVGAPFMSRCLGIF